MKKLSMYVCIAASTILLSTNLSGNEKSLNDLFMEKSEIIYVIAERPNESLLQIWPVDGLFRFGDATEKEAMLEYCSSVGGTATTSELSSDIFSAQFLYRHSNITCKAPNGKGFSAKFFSPKYSNNDKSNAWMHVKYDSPQPTGYYMKALNKKLVTGKYKSIMDLRGSDTYGAGSLKKGIGICVEKGGKYLMATKESQGYAIDANDYFFAIADKIGAFENEYSDGKHWCIDTKDKADEFTVTSFQGKYYREFKPEMGVNRDEIKIFKGALPPYYMKSTERPDEPAMQPSSVDDNTLKMSKSSTPAMTALASKTISSKNTVLERQNGSVLEGVYLGQNDSGCQLAAVMTAPDQSYGHTSVYNDKKPANWIMNYKQCSNAPIEYLGESFERSFPASITQEYSRVLNMCRIRGAAMGSFMGYNIDCSRQGSMAQPVHEVTITKKDKLVIRAYEK